MRSAAVVSRVARNIGCEPKTHIKMFSDGGYAGDDGWVDADLWWCVTPRRFKAGDASVRIRLEIAPPLFACSRTLRQLVAIFLTGGLGPLYHDGAEKHNRTGDKVGGVLSLAEQSSPYLVS